MTVQPLSPSVSLIVLPLHPVTEEISMGDIRDFKVIIIPVTTGWVLRILYTFHSLHSLPCSTEETRWAWYYYRNYFCEVGRAREWRGPRGREPRVNHERRFLSPEWVTSGPFPTSLSPPPPAVMEGVRKKGARDRWRAPSPRSLSLISLTERSVSRKERATSLIRGEQRDTRP